MRLYVLLPKDRIRAYILLASLVIAGAVIGLLRTPPNVAGGPPTDPMASVATAGFLSASGLGGIGGPEGNAGAGNQDLPVQLVSYTVESGDTLSSIAQEFNTSSDSIAYINSLSSPDRINVGFKLTVMKNASGVVVKVAGGDTLSGICSRFDVEPDEIVEVNHLADANSLSVGQTLLLPGAKPSRAGQILSRSNSLSWPVRGSISSAYGWRTHPVYGTEGFHEGIDIAASLGAKVAAAATGKVTFVGWSGDYGRLIVIDHGGGVETAYGHLNDYNVSTGNSVVAGQIVGYVGESGNATGPHLHFEVRKNGSTVNPRSYLP